MKQKGEGDKEGEEKIDVTVKISGDILQQVMTIRSDREKITGKPTSIAELVREAIRFWYKLKHQEGGSQIGK